MAILTIPPVGINPGMSNHPDTGLKRSLDVISLNIGSSAITLSQIVYQLDASGNRLDTSSMPAMTIPSIATNNTLVDPATGLYVIQDNVGSTPATYVYDGGTQNGNPFTGTPVPEYVFLIAMLNTPVNINQMITQYVLLNDLLGEYNV